MKNLYFVFALGTLAMLSSCSKKNVVVSDNEHYKMYSHQLEANYPAFADESNISQVPEANLSASTDIEAVAVAPTADSRFEKPAVAVAKKRADMTKQEVKAEKIRVLKEKILDKMQTKRIQKLLKKQNTQDVSGGQIVAGIIIGIIGLILLAIAGATGAPNLVWIGGAVLFVAGVILILVGAF